MDSVNNTKKMTRRPSSPGEILKNLYMEPMALTVSALAERIGVSRKALSALINGHTSLSFDMAMRLGRVFSTGPQVWLNLQRNLDLWLAEKEPGSWRNIRPIKLPKDVDVVK